MRFQLEAEVPLANAPGARSEPRCTACNGIARAAYSRVAAWRRAPDVTLVKRLDHRHQLRSAEGVPLVHVKPRTGAPYNAAAEDEALAVAEGVRDVDPGLVVACLAGSPVVRVVRGLGLACAEEAFADRGDTSRGTLVRRGEPGAVVQDPQAVAERASRIARERTVVAVDGTTVRVAADTLCLHGDTPGAAVLAEAIRARLKVDGVEVRRLRFS